MPPYKTPYHNNQRNSGRPLDPLGPRSTMGMMSVSDEALQDEEEGHCRRRPSMNHNNKSEDTSATSTNDNPKTPTSSFQEFLGNKESARVFQMRLLVITAILVAAIVVSWAVYYLTASAQAEEFETQFEGASSKIVTTFESIVSNKLSAIGGLAIQASLYARSMQQVWPNVTLQEYCMRSQVAMELSGALYAQMAPVVTNATRKAWEEYSVENTWWLQEAEAYDKARGLDFGSNNNNGRRLIEFNNLLGEEELQEELQELQDQDTRQTEETEQPQDAVEKEDPTSLDFSSGIPDQIFTYTATGPQPVTDDGPFFPSWQVSYSFGAGSTVNFDAKSYGAYQPYLHQVLSKGEMALGGIQIAPPGFPDSQDLTTAYYATLVSLQQGKLAEYQGDPMSTLFVPVFDDPQASNRTVVAVILSLFQWASYLQGLLPHNFPGLIAVLENRCADSGVQAFTYKIVGEDVEFLQAGDHHQDYTHRPDMVRTCDFESDTTNVVSSTESAALGGIPLNQELCQYHLKVYPSKELQDEYLTMLPVWVTLAVALVFAVTGLTFWLFNKFVEQRQKLVMEQAVKTTQIVDSLFPEQVRDRLMDASEYASGKAKLKSFLDTSEDMDGSFADQHASRAITIAKPIADLFPHCTVFVSDIAGFTAWSSTRNPTHVFTLLESIYQSFDKLAKRHEVFKVETVGDTYVAVTGLPNPNDKHALVMARFASACIEKFAVLANALEPALGPDTADLGLRIGMHSGPVTAGVLRGERCRFQLFGDTVHTAARMETMGEANRIQVTKTTADLLIAAGKEAWVKRREDPLNVTGKGIVESFWIAPGSKGSRASDPEPEQAPSRMRRSNSFSGETVVSKHMDPKMKHDRLVNWMVELFKKRISTIVAHQDPNKAGTCHPEDLVYHVPEGKTSLDEVAEVINLPQFDPLAAGRAMGRSEVEIDQEIEDQLFEIVATIANMYKENPFHNFQHACHVTMAVDKFMSRIVAPDMDEDVSEKDHTGIAGMVHQYTHGINSDPITLFAIVFSAFIHDADHRGVSNMQLGKEDEMMAELYKNKSIAEQNSLDLAWELLSKDRYANLRAALFVDREEMMRFRQVVVNMVLATDIFDKELNDLRKGRWNRAFDGESERGELHSGLRATIVIEHIIQAADVSHTMQHWRIYRKWNERLFTEMYKAFVEGRMGKSPAEFWYKGELGFFDNYIIPLAKKLAECEVFGVSSDECLNYAIQNRQEWESKGLDITESMLRTVERKFPSKKKDSSSKVQDIV